MPYIGVGTENSGAIELHYEDHGTGSPVGLIHGYPHAIAWTHHDQVNRALLDFLA